MKNEGCYFVVAADKEKGYVRIVPPDWVMDSEEVLFDITDRRQRHRFAYYCEKKYNIDVYCYEGSPDEFKELWNKFNSNGSI